MTSLSPSLVNAFFQNQWFGSLTFGFRRAVEFNYVGTAQRVAGDAYKDQFDKGTTTSLWSHIRKVVEATENFSGDQMTERRFAMATLHELFEVRDRATDRHLYTPRRLMDLGFDDAFVRGALRLRHMQGDPYLNYIHGIAKCGDMDVIASKIGDLRVNMPMRAHGGELSDRLMEKKNFLYPLSEAYLVAVYLERINPHAVTPIDFLRQNPGVVKSVPNSEMIARHYAVPPLANVLVPQT